MSHRSLPHLVRSLARTYGPKPVLSSTTSSGIAEFTWIDLRDAAWTLAGGLIEAGFPAGGRAVILSEDSPEALFAEVGVTAAGGVAVPLAPPASSGEVAAILVATGSAAMISSADCLPLGSEAVAAAGRPLIEWQLDPVRPGRPTPVVAEGEPAIEARLETMGPEVPAVVLRTRGTTGSPRLVELTHRGLIGTGEALARALSATPSHAWLAAGPLTHPFVRVAGWWAPLASGGQAVLGGIDPLAAAWATRPRVAACLATDLQSLAARLVAEVRTAQGVQGRLARWAIDEAATPGRGGIASWFRRAAARAAGPEVLRGVVGGELDCLIAGWGPVDESAVRILSAVGVEVYTAWGLTEATGVVALGRPGAPPGGTPLPGVTVTADGSGELLVAGPGVMFSYVGMSPEVNPALAGGSLRTGDLGRVDASGTVVLEGRTGGPDGGPDRGQ